MLPELTQDEYSAALDAVAASVLDALEVGEPPIDALALARALGLDVAWDARQAGRGRVVRLGGSDERAAAGGSIMLRPDPRRERLQWAIAHEIGETCACEVFGHLGVDPREAPSGAREMVANQLAGRLLIPRQWFRQDGPEHGWDLLALKQRYATASHELVARRMLDFPPPVSITIFDQGRRTFRRSNLSGRQPPLGEIELAARRAAHDSGGTVVEEGPLCRVQAWGIHEADWKREVLRTEWNVEGLCDAFD